MSETQRTSVNYKLEDVRKLIAEKLINRAEDLNSIVTEVACAILGVSESDAVHRLQAKMNSVGDICGLDSDFGKMFNKKKGKGDKDEDDADADHKFDFTLVTQIFPSKDESRAKSEFASGAEKESTIFKRSINMLNHFQKQYFIKKWLMRRGEMFTFESSREFGFTNLKQYIDDNMPMCVDEVEEKLFLENDIPAFSQYKKNEDGTYKFMTVEDTKVIKFKTLTFTGHKKERNVAFLLNYLKQKSLQESKGVAIEVAVMIIMVMLEKGRFKHVKKELEFLIGIMGRYTLYMQNKFRPFKDIKDVVNVDFGRYNAKTKVFNIGWDSDYNLKLTVMFNAIVNLIASEDVWNEFTSKKLWMISVIFAMFSSRTPLIAKKLSTVSVLFMYAKKFKKSNHCHPVFRDFKPRDDWIKEALWQPAELCRDCDPVLLKRFIKGRSKRLDKYVESVLEMRVSNDVKKNVTHYVQNIQNLILSACDMEINWKAPMTARLMNCTNVLPFLTGPSGAITQDATKKAAALKERHLVWRKQNEKDANRNDEIKMEEMMKLSELVLKSKRFIQIETASSTSRILTNRSGAGGTVGVKLYDTPESKAEILKMKAIINDLENKGKRGQADSKRRQLNTFMKEHKPVSGTSTAKTVIMASSFKGLDFTRKELIDVDEIEEREKAVLDLVKRNKNVTVTSGASMIGERKDQRNPRQIYMLSTPKFIVFNLVFKPWLDFIRKPTINIGSDVVKAEPVNVGGTRTTPPSYFGTYDIFSDTSIPCKAAMMPIDKADNVMFCCDFSEFDKGVYATDIMLPILNSMKHVIDNDVVLKNDPFFRVPLCTIDGKEYNFYELIDICEKMAEGHYYFVTSPIDEFSQFIPSAPSGSPMTFISNTTANWCIQKIIEKRMSEKTGSNVLITGAQIIGDDCLTCNSSISKPDFSEHDLEVFLDVFDEITDEVGMSVSSLKSTCFVTETAKNSMMCGMVTKTRSLLPVREKPPRSELRKVKSLGAAVLGYMAEVRNAPTQDGEDFFWMYSMMITESYIGNDSMITIKNPLCDMLPNDLEGGGFGLISSNDETSCYLLTLGFDQLMMLICGVNELFKETMNKKVRTEMAKEMFDVMQGKDKSESRIDFEKQDAAMREVDVDNLRLYLNINQTRIAQSENNIESLEKIMEDKIDKSITGRKRKQWLSKIIAKVRHSSYANTHLLESQNLADAIRIDNEIRAISLKIEKIKLSDVISNGRTIVQSLKLDQPLLYDSAFVQATAYENQTCTRENSFPMGSKWFQSCMDEFGQLIDKPGDRGLLPAIQRILSDLSQETGHYVPMITFLTMIGEIRSSDIDINDVLFPLLSALFGDNEKLQEAATALSSLLVAKVNFAEYSENSTVNEYINCVEAASRIKLTHSRGYLQQTRDIKRSFVPLLVWLSAVTGKQFYDMEVKVPAIIISVCDYKIPSRLIAKLQEYYD